jgi:hypothetical protein
VWFHVVDARDLTGTGVFAFTLTGGDSWRLAIGEFIGERENWVLTAAADVDLCWVTGLG